MSGIIRLGLPALLVAAGASFAVAQGTRTEASCDDNWYSGDRSAVHICEDREFTLPQGESLQIDGRPNGSVSVTGWDGEEIQVIARVRTWADDEEVARARLDEIEVETDNRINADGPDVRNSWWPFGRRQGGWNVSYEVMAPHDTDVWVETVNGRISVTAMRGHIDVETVNGGISLNDVSATVRGRTVNGGITAELAGTTIDGEALDLRTTNGGIVMRIPEDFSARLDIETVNGGVQSDFPVTREGHRNREVSGTLGEGGPLIRARTVNGGVQVRML